MASASVHRIAAQPAKATKGMTEKSRIEAALKQAAKHARQQLAAQGLKLPTQGWKRATIHNPVV